MKRLYLSAIALLIFAVLLSGCSSPFAGVPAGTDIQTTTSTTASGGSASEDAPAPGTLDEIYASLPGYSGQPWVQAGDGKARFTADEIAHTAYEEYLPLDALGRCTECIACLGKELMPTEKRGEIYMVRPTGWQSSIYDFVDGGSLYNRCHLIGYQLSGENANERNLITGTRYLNTEGMLPFENMVADYIHETDGLVMYRVTPYFSGNELVCRGIFMEGYSVDDGGDEINYFVFCYNVQPGIEIDYSDGANRLAGSPAPDEVTAVYILNKNSKKFHLPECPGVNDISDKNKRTFEGARSELIGRGYTPCNQCKP